MTEAKTPYIGRRIPRVDALDKVTGSAKYGFDVELPGMLYGATLRSPLAHAKIVKIDTSKALKAPGVKAVVTGKDFPFTYGTAINDQPFLAIDRVRYIGEPVAAVAAETEIEAREAVEKIRVTYDELPAVFDAREAAAADAPLLHPDLGSYTRGGFKSVPGTNILVDYTYSLGDIETGFAEADEIFEDEFSAHTLSQIASTFRAINVPSFLTPVLIFMNAATRTPVAANSSSREKTTFTGLPFVKRARAIATASAIKLDLPP